MYICYLRSEGSWIFINVASFIITETESLTILEIELYFKWPCQPCVTAHKLTGLGAILSYITFLDCHSCNGRSCPNRSNLSQKDEPSFLANLFRNLGIHDKSPLSSNGHQLVLPQI